MTTTRLSPSALDRFWSKVDRGVDPGGCWIWTGDRVRDGYGSFFVSHSEPRPGAHRLAYELLVGPILPGLVMDHLCRNTACVNPAHLEPVTNRENILRGVSLAAINASKTHCIHGHPFDEANTLVKAAQRSCRACHRATQARYRARLAGEVA